MKQNIDIILASGSPRRRELLTQAGLTFETLSPDLFEEHKGSTPDVIVQNLARDKCIRACEILKETSRNPDNRRFSRPWLPITAPALVVAADTDVAMTDFTSAVLGKPSTACGEEFYEKVAMDYLYDLSGRSHFVFTGVYCRFVSPEDINTSSDVSPDDFFFVEKTEVTFRRLTRENIIDYVLSHEPVDKAGAYGIQGMGCRLVESIKGDYNNVVGFPLSRFVNELIERGYITFDFKDIEPGIWHTPL